LSIARDHRGLRFPFPKLNYVSVLKEF
jgi:hypothetical protein